jgi:hypothetical protein
MSATGCFTCRQCEHHAHRLSHFIASINPI